MARICTLLLFYSVLVCVGVEDLKKRTIKNTYQRMILFLAAVSVFVVPEISPFSRALGMFMVGLPMAFLALIFPGSFGGGDVKLTVSCGAFLGWRLLGKGTALAIFFAGTYSLYLIVKKRGKGDRQFAFGPFLSLGYMLSCAELFFTP